MRNIVPLLIFVFIASCSKAPDWDCGIVEGSRVKFLDANNPNYFLDIRNECTSSLLTDIEVTERVYNQYAFEIDTQRICNISGKRLN